MCYNQTGDISTLEGIPLKLEDKITYLGSSVESIEKDIKTRLTKAWTAINRLSIIWKSDLTDKMKRSFFQAAVTSILLYVCTTWTPTKRLEKKLDGSWGQHPVSSHSCWMYVRAGRPAFARPCVGVHKSTSLMSSSLLLQQCAACLLRLTWIVFMIGGRWPYRWCLVGCCRQDLFKIARSILV